MQNLNSAATGKPFLKPKPVRPAGSAGENAETGNPSIDISMTEKQKNWHNFAPDMASMMIWAVKNRSLFPADLIDEALISAANEAEKQMKDKVVKLFLSSAELVRLRQVLSNILHYYLMRHISSFRDLLSLINEHESQDQVKFLLFQLCYEAPNETKNQLAQESNRKSIQIPKYVKIQNFKQILPESDQTLFYLSQDDNAWRWYQMIYMTPKQ